ncbi:MAG TPA: prenyltransferase [Candidatus Polarisedimenticolaceae bacterium]|nr:prenyltransferase [Candidatus Polarisedimenticolaceae bacterium]
MDRLRPLLDAARLDRAMLAPCAVFAGSSYARYDAQPGPGIPAHLVVSVAALLAGIGVNFVDEAWDLAGAPPSDGLDAREAAICGGVCLTAAILVAWILAPLSGAAAVGFGLLAVLLGVARGVPVAGLDTLGHGLGDLANAVALGPLAVTAGFASQCGRGSSGAALFGIPVGIIAASALYTRHFNRREADLRHERLTPVTIYGEDRARLGLVLLPILGVLAIAAVVALEEAPAGIYAAAAPLVLLAGLSRRGDTPPERSICIVAATAILVLAAALRLAVR